ncbi:kinase-like domain-containing protein [Fomitopsis serialis]|uniref:kinase-like domain-containing protein n=1 Tax=Fomitopsis serialis TaxID=139415 RepID=UPI0020072C91|nr:kinase-like domain-containing protein [Neoantrodia serialis]KAH9931005.1 kinase-like domain-containing protein [Neoantrodia serialis]
MLRKLCVEYGVIPTSLILQHHSITLETDRTRPQESGGCADIYLGRWNGQLVGVKAIRTSERDSHLHVLQRIAREAALWRCLAHPNVAPFYGIDREQFELSMICKWMPNGHIIKFLGNNPNASRPPLIADVACGLEFLHSDLVGIVHGDLKGANVLVDEQGRACLSDFGLSTTLYNCDTLNTVSQHTGFRSTIRWMPPELHDPEMFRLNSATPSKASDIYSYAMVMWEIFTGKVPYEDVNYDGAVIRKVMSGERPQRPVEVSDAIWSIMEDCWKQDYRKRPPIWEVRIRLEAEWYMQFPCGLRTDTDQAAEESGIGISDIGQRSSSSNLLQRMQQRYFAGLGRPVRGKSAST